jgi:hypothetical protein
MPNKSRFFYFRIVAIVIIAFAAGRISFAAPDADLVLINGNIITVDNTLKERVELDFQEFWNRE